MRLGLRTQLLMSGITWEGWKLLRFFHSVPPEDSWHHLHPHRLLSYLMTLICRSGPQINNKKGLHRKLPYEHLLKSFLKKHCLNNSTKRLPGALHSLPQPRSSAIVIRTLFWWKLWGDGEQAGNRCVGKRLLKGGAGKCWNMSYDW